MKIFMKNINWDTEWNFSYLAETFILESLNFVNVKGFNCFQKLYEIGHIGLSKSLYKSKLLLRLTYLDVKWFICFEYRFSLYPNRPKLVDVVSGDKSDIIDKDKDVLGIW